MQKQLFLLISLCAILIFLLGCTGKTEEYHAHTDFKMIIEGELFDFNKVQYMSSPYRPLSENVHMHDFNPNVIHFHDKKATLGDFFTSIGMVLSKDCIDTGSDTFCSGENGTLQMYVNGVRSEQFQEHKPKDLDKILILYGPIASAQDINILTDQSCIYSEKCEPPEGFELPDESCSVGEPCTLEEDQASK
ncbi:MAG TPA: hypothetical protein VJG83_05790 [archaeon]|nr:hypothetical protein [archaeon]